MTNSKQAKRETEDDAEVQSMTAAELAVDNVPVPGESELPELDREEGKTSNEDETAE